ncbi:MAG: flippase-like domain-containing protein, partial [Chloroflexi bacterium]|nr:flippase-like domain-containing protein [Chloroflexota bacterium]
FLAAHVFNVVYPAKLGTVLRAHLVGEMSNISKSFAIGTVLGEKILDNAVWLCLILALLPIIPSSPWLHRIVTTGMIVLLFAVLALVLLFWFHGHLFPELIRRVNLFRRGWVQTLSTYLGQGLEGLAAANRREGRLSLLLLTLVVAGTNWLVAQTTLWALRIHVPWVAAPLVLGVLQWGTEVPSVPGNIGVFHYLCLLTLGVFGVEPSLAFTYGVVLHVLIMVLPTLIGLACLWSVRAFIWKWRQQERVATLVASPPEFP